MMAFCLSLSMLFLLLHSARAERDSGMKIGVPSVGWVFDRQLMALRPIKGTLGAATLGHPLDAGFPVENAVVGSQRSFALVVSAADHQVRVMLLGPGAPSVKGVEGTNVSPDRIVLSPSGTAAILQFVKSARLQIITGLPESPVVSREISTSGLGDSIAELAISDDGNRLLLNAGEIWMLDQT